MAEQQHDVGGGVALRLVVVKDGDGAKKKQAGVALHAAHGGGGGDTGVAA